MSGNKKINSAVLGVNLLLIAFVMSFIGTFRWLKIHYQFKDSQRTGFVTTPVNMFMTLLTGKIKDEVLK